MGVRGLQTYIENHCEASFSLRSIVKLAEENRSYRDQELIIVVDGVSFIKNMYADLSWIGGAQLKESAVRVQKFVDAFRNIGIRLVFFFDGPTVPKKRKTWVERKMVTMEKVYNVLHKIEQGDHSDSISLKDNFILPPGIEHQIKFILTNICKCDVYLSESECDEEIAHFTRSRGLFGVLGHDSDYLIFDIGKAFYFDTEHLDLTTMKTRVFYPEVLAQSLGLTKSQLPILATLMGNDIVRLDDLRDFHSRLNHERSRNLKRLVPNISSYIQNLPVDFIHDKVQMRKVSMYVFHSESRAQDIKTSILSYTTKNFTQVEEACQNRKFCTNESQRRGEISGRVSWGDHWSRRGGRGQRRKEIYTNWRQENREDRQEPCTETEEDKMWFEVVKMARQLHCGNKLPSKIYAIIKGLPWDIGTSFEDYRITPRDLPIWAELTKELRQRLYGILLQEKPVRPGSHKVEEWCMAGPGSLAEAKYNAAVMPSIVHPGLITLLSDQDRPFGALSDVRWTLFVHSVSPRLDVDKVRQLPPHLVITTMALHYIAHFPGPGRLEEWEADVVLATATVIRHYGPSELSEIAADPMTSRSIRVSHIIMRFSRYIENLVAASGFPLSREQTNPWNYFDGKLFQLKYREAEQLGVTVTDSWLCDNREDSLQDFRQARSIIFDDSCT